MNDVESWMKASGFTQIVKDGVSLSGARAKWVAAAAPLKRKKVAESQSANPWAALQTSSDVAVRNLIS
jgi:hypothetical protein